MFRTCDHELHASANHFCSPLLPTARSVPCMSLPGGLGVASLGWWPWAPPHGRWLPAWIRVSHRSVESGLCHLYFVALVNDLISESYFLICKEDLLLHCAQSCLTLCDPMACSPPGASDHVIFQARILGWLVISFSKGSSRSRDWTHISCVSCIGRQILYHCATWEIQVVSDTCFMVLWWALILVNIYWAFKWCWAYVNCFVWICSSNSHNSLWPIGLLFPFYKWSNWGSEGN